MLNHTPGPWKVIGSLDDLSVVNMDSDDLGSCDGVRRVAHVVQGGYEIPNYDEAEANARLIAAAPELVEALEGFIEMWGDAKSNSDLSYVADAFGETARALLNSLKGE